MLETPRAKREKILENRNTLGQGPIHKYFPKVLRHLKEQDSSSFLANSIFFLQCRKHIVNPKSLIVIQDSPGSKVSENKFAISLLVIIYNLFFSSNMPFIFSSNLHFTKCL